MAIPSIFGVFSVEKGRLEGRFEVIEIIPSIVVQILRLDPTE